jgi:transcriptional regulator with XRE-family HTH domain
VERLSAPRHDRWRCTVQENPNLKERLLTPQERFAHNLRRHRVAVGISQEELGERTDLHRTEISLLERAGREPRLATLLKLAGALGTTPNALCEGTGWDHEQRRFTVEEPPAS